MKQAAETKLNTSDNNYKKLVQQSNSLWVKTALVGLYKTHLHLFCFFLQLFFLRVQYFQITVYKNKIRKSSISWELFHLRYIKFVDISLILDTDSCSLFYCGANYLLRQRSHEINYFYLKHKLMLILMTQYTFPNFNKPGYKYSFKLSPEKLKSENRIYNRTCLESERSQIFL